MSLKVLLADDSAAIKKVVQLSLQDLGVELKAVGSGKEVLEAARLFGPDIAFIDVLLPQKSGYEVTSELKNDPTLKNVPVVMLWSAFMAFDEAKYQACGAQAKLEKPFDIGALRKLVNELVVKVESNPFAASLDFPNMSFEQPIGSVPPSKKAAPAPASGSAHAPAATQTKTVPLSAPVPAQAQAKSTPPPTDPLDWGTSAFEDINAFASKIADSPDTVTRTRHFDQPQTPAPSAGDWGSDNEWVRKDLGKFKVPVPEEALEDSDNEGVAFEYTENKVVDTSFLFKPQNESTFAGESRPRTHFEPVELEIPIPSQAVLSLEELSDIKKETREIIEKAVWKLVPEIASQIIREELERLLSEDK